MTFWDYFEEVSNLPVIIVILCILIRIFYSFKTRIKIFLWFVITRLFYPIYIAFAFLFSLGIRKSRDKGL